MDLLYPILSYFSLNLNLTSKLDHTFQAVQISNEGFCRPYRHDHCSNCGNIPLYLRSNIPSRLLTFQKGQDGDECLFVELSIQKKRWLLCGSNKDGKKWFR